MCFEDFATVAILGNVLKVEIRYRIHDIIPGRQTAILWFICYSCYLMLSSLYGDFVNDISELINAFEYNSV